MAIRDTSLCEEEALSVLSTNLTTEEAGVASSSERVLNGVARLALEQLRDVPEHRPQTLECDVWRFQNKKEKWVAFVGLLDKRPYEIFTGLQDDEEGIVLPKSVNTGWIVKNLNIDGSTRYDFSFQNKRGYRTTVEGLSARFNKEYWNYAKLISGVLRYRMPLEHVIRLIDSLQLENDTINTWKVGVVRALKKYISSENEGDETESGSLHCACLIGAFREDDSGNHFGEPAFLCISWLSSTRENSGRNL